MGGRDPMIGGVSRERQWEECVHWRGSGICVGPWRCEREGYICRFMEGRQEGGMGGQDGWEEEERGGDVEQRKNKRDILEEGERGEREERADVEWQ